MATFLNYGKQWIGEDDIRSVVETLQSDFLTQGPKIDEFEKLLCEYTGAEYAIAVTNGTAALHLAVAALNIETGCEGITTPNTFVASANSMIYNGLIPVFADIDEKTYNISVSEIEKNISKKTKLIVPVDFAGQAAAMEEIYDLAKKNGLYVIEDACHAIGSTYKNGSMVGSCQYSDMTVFSFHPVKTITTGEGGAITTNDKKIYERLLLLRSHGITKQNMSQNPGPWYYEMQELGFNFRLSDIQAALGITQLKKLDTFSMKRKKIVARYNETFKDIPWLIVPYEKTPGSSCFHLYVLQIDFDFLGKSREEVMQELREKGIGTQVHYIPVHTQPYYREKFGYKPGDFPAAGNYYEKALSIPLFPRMAGDDVEYVIKCILDLKK